MAKKIFVLFIPFLVIISCASKEEKLQAFKDYVQKISTEIKFEDGINNIKVSGERRSIYRSYFIDKLVFINENMNIGNRGQSVNQYYFKDDKFIHFEEKTILIKDDSLNIQTKTSLNSSFYLADEEILESERIIGGVQKPFTNEEINWIVNHAQILKELAEKNKPKK